MSGNIHIRFKHFVECNLLHPCPEFEDLPVYKLYNEFSKLKWKGTNEQLLLKNPNKLTKLSKYFLQLIDDSENKALPWFVVGRQVQLSDSMFQRCLNLYKSRFLNVTLKNKDVVDLGVLDYLNKMNNTQLIMRLPNPKPCISLHTARLMRELWILKKEYNIQYTLRTDDEQMKEILKQWFETNYTLKCEEGTIGYPRRQLLEECNDYLVREFGDTKVLYCHAKPWRWLMKNIIGIDDNVQKGHYLRLPVWKKNIQGNAILNVRKSVGTGGEFTLEKRADQRLINRRANKRERDCARKVRDKKKKKQKNSVI